MPVYAYACASCGHAFDARQSFDEPALTVCERCGGSLRKQYGTIGVTFNGPGFYRTDSRASSGAGSSAGKGTSGASKSEGSSSSSSSSKAPSTSGAGAASAGSSTAA